jgi:hypothetical protein
MCDSTTLPGWGMHVDGAAALIQVRGHGMLNSPLSRSLFFFVRKSVVSMVTDSSIPHPSDVLLIGVKSCANLETD